MLTRVVSRAIPKDIFEMELLSSNIKNEIIDYFLQDAGMSQEEVASLLQSPAMFAVTNAFMLKEYLKNINDAQGSQIDIYVQINPDKSVMCLVRDDGPGFPDKFLEKDPGEKLVSYYDKKLVNEEGGEKSRIVSSKTGEDKVGKMGGQGLGLATAARVLEMTNSSLLIGNVADLAPELIANMELSAAERSHGAIIMANSPAFNLSMLNNFQNIGQKSLVNMYPKHVRGVAEDVKDRLELMQENQDTMYDDLTSRSIVESDDIELPSAVSSSSHSSFNQEQFRALTLEGVEDDDEKTIELLESVEDNFALTSQVKSFRGLSLMVDSPYEKSDMTIFQESDIGIENIISPEGIKNISHKMGK